MRHMIRLVISALAVVLMLPAAAFATGAPALERAPVNPDFKKARAMGLVHRASPVDLSGLAGAPLAPALFVPPASYDLRLDGKVSSVKNQGAYGTCWAFAALASLESVLLPGEAWDFSEESLAWWHGFDWSINEGGNDYIATAVLTRWGGPFTEAQDPYDDDIHPDPAGLAVQKHVQNVLFLPPRLSATDNADIKYALMTYGAVSTGMYMSESSLYFNDTTDAFYYPYEEDWENHGVTIVGWDDNYAASNFATTPPGNGAFLVKNSWGTAWGADGYFWLSYFDAMTAYDLSAVYYGVEATDNYARVYQHDPLGYVWWMGYAGDSWMANSFTAAEDGTLQAAGFYTTGPNTSYEVYTGSSLTSRQPQASGTFTGFGYHTVSLAAPVPLTTGQQFHVIVKLTTPDFRGKVIPEIAIEEPYSDYSSAATASAGQSWYSPNGTAWYDMTGYSPDTNVCVKAYAGGALPATSLALTSPSATLAKYGATYNVTGALTAGAAGVAGKTVVLQRSTTSAGPFTDTSVTDVTEADGSFSLPCKPTTKTWYRVRFAGEYPSYGASFSDYISVLPRAYVGNPVAPTVMYAYKAKSVYGYLKPRHTAGTYPVRIYKYRYVSGKWKSYGYVKAKAANYSTYTKYTGSVKLAYKGKWRLRAYHPADAGHAASWSAGYDYVTVK